MTEIKESLQRIREASLALKKNIDEPDSDTHSVAAIHRTLAEINTNVEQLKLGVEQYQNSPIRLRKM